ncbi:hypothetical protein GCM10009693_08050 [Leucobacter chromiireducens subsp. chromiireducens]
MHMRTLRQFAGLGLVLALCASASPAMAAPLQSATRAAAKDESVNSASVGKRPSQSVTAFTKENYASPRYAVNVIGYFSEHKTNSVKLTKLRICYSGSKSSSLWMSPSVVRPSGKGTWTGGRKTIPTGKCQEWSGINRVYSKSKYNELFRVDAYANGSNLTVHGFKR